MAILRGEIQFSTREFQDLVKQFPDFGGRLLALIGKRGRTVLKEDYLSGQEIDLRAFPRDAMGRYTTSSDVNRRRTEVKIYSYPVNLFEKGRRLRSGRKEPAKNIIRGKLKQAVMSRLGSYTNEFERSVLDPEIKRLGF